MKKQEITLYSFNELSEKTKEKLLKDETELQLNYFLENELEELLTDEANSLLKDEFTDVTNLKLLYDFSYSQGSGLLTEFLFTYKNEVIEVKQNPFNHHYTFTSNFTLELDYYNSKLSAKDIEDIKDKIIAINEKLLKQGYSLIEDEYYKEVAEDYLKSLDEEFLENGEYFRY